MQCSAQVQIFQMYLPASIFHLEDAGSRFLPKKSWNLNWDGQSVGSDMDLKTIQMLNETVPTM